MPDSPDLALQAATGHGATGRERRLGTVLADEVHVGRKEKGARGRTVCKKAWVAVEEKRGRHGTGPTAAACRRLGSERGSLPARCCEDSSLLRTDGWPNDPRLQRQGCRRDRVVTGGAPDRLEREFARVHRVAVLLGRWLLRTHQDLEGQRLDASLDEFTFRFNRSTSRPRGQLSCRLLQQAAKTDPVARDTTIGGLPVQPVVREVSVE